MRERLCIRCTTEQCAAGSHFCQECLDKKSLEVEEQRKDQKKCTVCGEWKESSTIYFYRDMRYNVPGQQKLRSLCKDCECRRQKKWHRLIGKKRYYENIKHERLLRNQSNARRKIRILTHYSGGTPACVCCGETYIHFLQLDHVEGKGNIHRAAISKKAGTDFQCWIVRNNFPSGYQVLCANCHMAKTILGRCPRHD